MASTYSNLKIQLMATGENSGTWGNVTNVNLGTAIEQAMVESATVTFSSANVTLTLTDTNAAQNARALRLNLTGTTGGARDLIVPAIQKPYIVNNGTADTITVKVSGQTGIAVPASKTMLVYNNGTDVVDAINHLSALNLGTALPIASGGTGSTSTTYANLESNVSGTLPVANGGTGAATLTSEAVVIGNTTGAVKFVSPGTDGNVLTSNGTAWVSEAPVVPQGVPTGTIATFAGDPGAGWLECNGQVVSQSTYSDLYAKVGLLADALQTDSVTFSDQSVINTGMYSNPAFGNSTYVIGGVTGSTNNFNWTSTDAITWTKRSFGWVAGTNYISNLIYTDKFVAANFASGTAETNRLYFATSTDGITWTQRTAPVGWTSPTSGGLGLVYGNSTYVTVTGNKVATSTDGITWTQRTLAVTSAVDSWLTYGGGIFLVTGYTNSPRRLFIQTSTDGITWTFRSVGWPQWGTPLPFYAGSKFYLSLQGGTDYGGMGSLYTSTDAITWTDNTAIRPIISNTVERIGYDSVAGLTYAVGSMFQTYATSAGYGGRIFAVSSDGGDTWQALKMGARVIPTTTNTQYYSSNNTLAVNVYSMETVNSKFIVSGGLYNWGDDNLAVRLTPMLKTIDSSYTYQTDTQFVTPFAVGITTGMLGGSLTGGKTSVAGLNAGVAGKNTKYYIKT
jgi:hypothetical protein